MTLAITLLGPPRVARDGRAVTFETRKATALLALLALTRQPRSREALCELLYPGQDADRARGALRRTLSTLRSGIGERWLTTAGGTIALRRGPGLEVDVERFRALAGPGDASVARLEEAVALHGGPFLEGFSLRDAPTFEDWQLGQEGELERELGLALGRLVAVLVDGGQPQRALGPALRRLALDPLHEPAHRQVIRLYAWTGDRAAALEQYRTCVRTLSRELGVAPLPETAALYEQVSEGSLPPPAPPAPPSPPAAPAPAPTSASTPAAGARPPDLPLVGRADELTALCAAHAAADPDGGVVVIEGEAGIGKTRLVAELVRHARGEGAVVLTTRCYDEEARLPYGPVVELLRQAARDATPDGWPAAVHPQRLADASILLPDLAGLRTDVPAPPPLDGPGAQVRLLEGVAAVLGAASAGPCAGVVVLDDAHAADEATLDAVAYLGRRLPGRSLLLVVTWRSEAVPPGHRLRRLAVDLAQAGRAWILSPGRLDEAQVVELLRVTGAADEGTLARRVLLESEGLPLFVAECLVALDTGAQTPGALSDQMRGVLDGRLSGLDDAARQVLGAAAAIGRSFGLETLRRASGRSDEETVAALEQLVARGVVRELADAEEPVYDFSHEKLRARVYEQTGLARRRLLHARVAAALAGRHPGHEQAGVVANHLRLAGDPVGAAAQHRRAAEHAAALHAHADALAHLEAAVALDDADPAAGHERMGELRTLIGDYTGALAGFETAAAYAGPAAVARIEGKKGEIYHRRGEWDRAERSFIAALELVATEERGLRARLLADLGLTLHQTGRSGRAAELAAEALALADAAGDRRARAQSHNMLGALARSAGAPGLAGEHLQRSLDLARELDDVPAQATALNNLALVERDAGAVGAALELTEAALALCALTGDRHREAALENNLADLHHAAGEDDAAMTHLKRAVSIFSAVGADEATRLPEIWKLASW